MKSSICHKSCSFHPFLANDSLKNCSKKAITSKGLDSRKQVGWLLQRPKHVFKIKECCVFLQTYNCNFPFMQRAIEHDNATAGSEFDCRNELPRHLFRLKHCKLPSLAGTLNGTAATQIVHVLGSFLKNKNNEFSNNSKTKLTYQKIARTAFFF